MDIVTHDTIKSHLRNCSDVVMSNPMNVTIKGITGKQPLFEIAKNTDLKNRLNMPFQTNEDGRLSIDEKVSFIMNAKHDVIEMGIRLREFTSYFDSRNPTEFKNYIVKLLKNRVNLRCFAIDSEWALKNLPIESIEKKYYEEIPDTLAALAKFAKEASKKNFGGKVKIFTYKHQPLFHVQCTDGHTPEGRMTVSNYLFGIKRSQCPVLQFSKHHHPIMFETYWNSIQKTIQTSKPLKI